MEKKLILVSKDEKNFELDIFSNLEVALYRSITDLFEKETPNFFIFDAESFSFSEIVVARDFFEKKGIPLILVSGDSDIIESFSNCEVFGILSKPVSPRLLLYLTNRALRILERVISTEKFCQKLSELKENIIFSSISEHIIFQDIHNRIICANKAAADSIGLKQQDLIGKYCYELWHKRKLPCERCPVRDAIKYKEYREYEVFTEHDKRWWLIKGFPVFDGENVIGAIEMTQEITEKKRLLEEFERQRKILNLVMEHTTDLIYFYKLKPEPHFEYVSPSSTEMTGFTPEEYYNDPYLGYKIVHPDDKRILSDISPNSEIFNKPVVLRFYRKDSELIWVEQHNKPVYENGELVAIIGVARDITKRKVYEKELIKKERFLSSLISSLPGIAYICLNDENWTMKYISDAVTDILGYSPEDLIDNKRISYASLIHPDDRQMVYDKVQEGVKNKSHYEIEYRVITSKGEEKWVREKGIGNFDGERLINLVGYIYDITSYKKTQSELSNLLSEKELYLKELQHRVKNSFNMVISLISLEMNNNNCESSYILEILERLKKRIFSISYLYELLYYSGGIQSISIKRYLERIINFIKESFVESQRINLEYSIADREFTLKKSTYIGLILNELLTNSLKYSFENVEKPKIAVNLKNLDEERMCLEIFDNGKALLTEYLEAPKGFGLKLVKLLAGELGGNISVENLKEGKVIKFVFPLK